MMDNLKKICERLEGAWATLTKKEGEQIYTSDYEEVFGSPENGCKWLTPDVKPEITGPYGYVISIYVHASGIIFTDKERWFSKDGMPIVGVIGFKDPYQIHYEGCSVIADEEISAYLSEVEKLVIEHVMNNYDDARLTDAVETYVKNRTRREFGFPVAV